MMDARTKSLIKFLEYQIEILEVLENSHRKFYDCTSCSYVKGIKEKKEKLREKIELLSKEVA